MSMRIRFGIGAKVFLALAVIVGGTIVSCVTASILLSRVGDSVRVIARENLPATTASLELRAAVGELLASVPGLATRKTRATLAAMDGAGEAQK